MDRDVLVVGDVGGTHARLGTVENGRLAQVWVTANDAFPSFSDLLARYLADHPPDGPVRAALAIAAPIQGDVVAWTNRAWRFSVRELEAALDLRELKIVNDFEAVALSLPVLGDADLVHLGGPTRGTHDAPRLVLGPGTGLGLAGLVPHDGGWRVVPTEAGHAGLTGGAPREHAVLALLYDDARRVAEPVLSGGGFVRLHDAIRALDGLPPTPVTPEDVTVRGLSGDPVCAEALRLFVTLLGRFAGDAALTWGARGGVYLASGICTALHPLLETPIFREAFEDKGAMRAYVRGVPTWIVTAEHPALLGAAAALGAKVRQVVAKPEDRTC